MTTKKIRAIGTAVVVAVWAVLTAFAWFKPATAMSDAERRPLAQFPELSKDTLLSGQFMGAFETYTLDQFPLRDNFRQWKALFHYNVMGQMDNNNIYVADGYAAQMEYPLNQESVDHAIKQFNLVNRLYLQKNGCKVYTTVVPDKGYYLASQSGHLAMDYKSLFRQIEGGMPWATYVDITDSLTVEDYYRTDTHWRQEKLLPVAQKLTQAMGVASMDPQSMTVTKLDRPFYGVYYGQAALPMEPDAMYMMNNELLEQCTTYNAMMEPMYQGVHDLQKLSSKDLYDVFLSGLEEPVIIENPNATTDRELVVFRDSYGSSLVPLLLQDYAKVTLVDIRAGSTQITSLGFIDFSHTDVLFMYSALVLNGGYI